MKLGVLQIIDGLSYLHNSAKILHGNLNPTAIFVTGTKLWKIGGFQFAVGSNAKQDVSQMLKNESNQSIKREKKRASVLENKRVDFLVSLWLPICFFFSIFHI